MAPFFIDIDLVFITVILAPLKKGEGMTYLNWAYVKFIFNSLSTFNLSHLKSGVYIYLIIGLETIQNGRIILLD